jgi:hypothetical protein
LSAKSIKPIYLSDTLNWEFSSACLNHSRRWRQVGGPRRVSPTVLRAPRHIRQSRSCHRRERSFAHSGVRSVAHGLYRSLPFHRFPRRWNPTFLSSVQNLHLTFTSVRVIRGSISSSRRWRQVGGPQRVSPTVLKSAEAAARGWHSRNSRRVGVSPTSKITAKLQETEIIKIFLRLRICIGPSLTGFGSCRESMGIVAFDRHRFTLPESTGVYRSLPEHAISCRA